MDKKEKDIEFEIYYSMCRDCPNARRCHESCENCDEYEEALQNALQN